MAKTLLRSGFLDDFQAAGDSGQPVFESAWQIRETLRLRHQPIVECLAIPQRNEDGDHLDWYAPRSGKVVSWSAASASQRLAALEVLEKALQSVRALSDYCQQPGKTALQLFGRLLGKALHFPGSSYVYLIDDYPVITFWGFTALHQSACDEDIFACLREHNENPVTLAQTPDVSDIVSDPETPQVSAQVRLTCDENGILQLTQQQATPAVTAATTAAGNPEQHTTVINNKSKSFPGVFFVTALMLIVAAGLFIWQQAKPPPVVENKPRLPRVTEPVPLLTDTLPLYPAQMIEIRKPDLPAEPPVNHETDKNSELHMDADQVREGKTHFLNGNWSVNIAGHHAVRMHYRIKNNTGSASIQPGDNLSCKGGIYSGLHQSGTLMIKPRGRAQCSDGSRYIIPEIACKSGGNNVTQCSARYSEGTEIPVTLKKVSN